MTSTPTFTLTAALTLTLPLAPLPSAVTAELLAALLDTVALPVAACVPVEDVGHRDAETTLAMAIAAATSTLPPLRGSAQSLYFASVSSLLFGAAVFSAAVCFVAPLGRGLALVVQHWSIRQIA